MMKRAPSLVLTAANLLLIAVLVACAVTIATRPPRFDWVLSTTGLTWIATVSTVLVFLALVGIPLVTLAFAAADFLRGLRWQGLLSGGLSIGLILIPVLWMGFGGLFATREEARVNRAWATTLDPMDTFTSRYPENPSSDGALRLEAAAARIGIDAVRHDAPGTRPEESRRRTYEAIQKGLLAFVSTKTKSADDALDAPPPEVSAWLSANEAGIAALTEQVLHGDAIALETDWSRYETPLPNLSGLRGIVSVLVLYALEKERAGDSRAALDAMEASWRIGDALHVRGELISQLVAVSLDQMTLGGLRKVNDVPSAWQARIAEHDYRLSTLRALAGEAWLMSKYVKGSMAIDPRRRIVKRMWILIEAPYWRFMSSNFSDAVRKAVAEAKTADPCWIDSTFFDQTAEGSIARWNALGRIAMPSLSRAWSSAVDASLNVELTQRVLAARALKDKQGSWPAELPGLNSAVCPGAKWMYSLSPDGSVFLTLSKKPAYGSTLAFRASARHRNEKPAADRGAGRRARPNDRARE